MPEHHRRSGRRLVYLQYNGDYAELYHRLTTGGAENYGHQRYVLQSLMAATERFEHAWIVTHHSPTAFTSELTDTVTAVGFGVAPHDDAERAVRFLDEVDPTDIIVHFPFAPVLRWERTGGVRKLAILADSFNKRGPVARLRRAQLARELNRPSVTWIGNHGMNAARALTTWGVDAHRVVAWDYPRDASAVAAPRQAGPCRPGKLLYVGLVCDDKGVSCLLDACAVLNNRGADVELEVIGDGDLDGYEAATRRLRIDDRVRFRGRLPHGDVQAAMVAADIVVIPSLHDYGEGFPLTALEALTLRTPIAASDHPMFVGILDDGDTATVHRAGDPLSLARSIERLLDDPDLYRTLSLHSTDALARARSTVTWDGLVSGFVDGVDLSGSTVAATGPTP